MAIIKLCREFVITLVCSIIQVVGVFIEGIAKILMKTAECLNNMCDRLYECRFDKETRKRAKFDVPV